MWLAIALVGPMFVHICYRHTPVILQNSKAWETLSSKVTSYQDLRLHSHYKCWSGYTAPDKAGNSSAGGQKGSFGSYLSFQYGTNMKNRVWKIIVSPKFETLHSHHPLKFLIGGIEGKTYFPAWKYLVSHRTQRVRPGRDTYFVLHAL